MHQAGAKMLANIKPVLQEHKDWFWMDYWIRMQYDERVKMPKNVIIKGWQPFMSCCIFSALIVENIGFIINDECCLVIPDGGKSYQEIVTNLLGLAGNNILATCNLLNASHWVYLVPQLRRCDPTVDNAIIAIDAALKLNGYTPEGVKIV